MKKRFLSTGILFMALVALLAAMGIGYALWDKTLTITGTVNTGEVNAVWTGVFTDDDDYVDDVDKDMDDDDSCTDVGLVDDSGTINQFKDGAGNGLTSCDPMAPGRDPKLRWDKDVARCDAMVDMADNQNLLIEVTNGYPSYYCTVWGHIYNNGTIPLMIQGGVLVTAVSDQLTAGVIEGECGTQIDPGEEYQVGAWLHVEQAAAENATYTATVDVQLVQWNEYDPALCP